MIKRIKNEKVNNHNNYRYAWTLHISTGSNI